ncbi:MAG: AMP-binding protein, partial [bacterium]|nr:AMP-binding protein [bacterium]
MFFEYSQQSGYEGGFGGQGTKEEWLEVIKTKDRQKAFDLQRVPFRVTLCKLEAERYEMLPSFFIQLEKLPLTPNGKIDRKALPAPQIKGDNNYEAPTGRVEEALTAVCQQVLNLDKLGVNDNFFNLGGDSIKIIQIASRLRKYRLKLDAKDLFTYQTIKQLAPHVKNINPSSPQHTVEGTVPLTPIQEWFFQSSFTDSSHFNQSVMLYRKEGFDETILEKSLSEVVRHHDALRMVYMREATTKNTGTGTTFRQRNRGIEGELFHLEIIELQNLAEKNIKKRISMETSRIQAGIDLKNGPLVKLGLFKTTTGDHLLIVIHHLVVDGISWRILLEDIQTCLKQAHLGEPLLLPGKTDSFKHWSEKLREYATGKYGKKLFKELKYWETIESTEIKPLPVDREIREIGREKRKRKYYDSVSMNLDKTDTANLFKKVNWAYSTEINDILLAALALALKEWNQMEKILLNLEGHGRESIIEDVDINRTVGWFTGLFPVLLDLKHVAGDNISYTVKSVKETLRRIPNKGINYGILRYLTTKGPQVPRNINLPGKGPLCEGPEISFNYLGRFSINSGSEKGPGSFKMSPLSSGDGISPEMEQTSLININGMAAGDKLSLNFSYNRFLFRGENIQRLASLFKSYLQKIIHHTMNRKEKTLTPSDLGYTGITIEEMDRITSDIKSKLDRDTEVNGIYPLSPMQNGMLFHHVAEKNSNAYFEQTLLTIKGELDVQLFKKSFRQLIDRHDVLRTLFVHEGLDKPLQSVLEPGDKHVRFSYEDISHITDKTRMQAYRETLRRKDKEKGFELSGDMPMRIAIYKTGSESYYIIWSFSHIIMDGWCLGIVFKELMQLYSSLKKGTQLQLEPVTPYRNYIRWLEKQDNEEGLEFWRKYLEGYEQIATLPKAKRVDEGEKLNVEYRQAKLEWEIEPLGTSNLMRIAQQNGTTLNLVLQALWGLILMKYNNCRDVVFGTVVSGRTAGIGGIENMVGLFINTVPVRVTAAGEQEFLHLLKNLHSKTAKTNPYEYLSLAEIQARTSLQGNLFDHIIVFENYPITQEIKQSTKERGLPLEIDSIEFREQTNYFFNIIIVPGKSIKIKFSYNATVYDNIYVENIRHHFNEVITQATENPHLHLDSIRIITEKEKKQILYEFNDTAADYPRDKTIHQLFEEQVEKTPDNISIVGNEKPVGSWQYAVGKGKTKDNKKIKGKKEIKDNCKTQEQLPQMGAAPDVEGIHEFHLETPSTHETHVQESAVTYRELNDKSNRLALYLQSQGVETGTIIAIMVERSIEMIIGLLGR